MTTAAQADPTLASAEFLFQNALNGEQRDRVIAMPWDGSSPAKLLANIRQVLRETREVKDAEAARMLPATKQLVRELAASWNERQRTWFAQQLFDLNRAYRRSLVTLFEYEQNLRDLALLTLPKLPTSCED